MSETEWEDKLDEVQKHSEHWYEMYSELKAENAELKKFKRECETSICRAEGQYNYEKLTEAKSIIRELLDVATSLADNTMFDVDKDAIAKAEEFLKE